MHKLDSTAQDAEIPADIAKSLASEVGSVKTVARFSVSQSEFPEGLAIDKYGNIYAALTVTGRIWKRTLHGQTSVVATLDVGSHGGFLVGLAIDQAGTLYVIDGTGEVATHGLEGRSQQWRGRIFAVLDPAGFPNALAFDAEGIPRD